MSNKIRRNRGPFEQDSKLSTISTVVLIALMLLYLVLTIVSSVQLAKQTDIISQHPFEVVISAGDIKLDVSEMSLRTNRLTSHHDAEDVALCLTALRTLRESTAKPLSQMEKLYLGDIRHVKDLEKTLSQLQTQQEAYFEYIASPNATPAGIEAFEQEHLAPLYTRALEQSDKIITVAQEKKVGYGETANKLRKQMLTGSVILISLMAGVLLFSQSVQRNQRKELAYRNHLFDTLSLNIDDTFVIRDARTGTPIYTALNMERVLGFSAGDPANICRGIKKQDDEEIRCAVSDPQFASPYEKVVEYTKPNGDKRWIFIRVYRITHDRLPQTITVFSDRTEEIQSHRALLAAMQGAEQASSAKSDFLSRMSHEIRTPLNAIIGMTTIAEASVNHPGRIKDCLTKISFSSKHLLSLINDVLDMSKIESNKMILQKEPFDLFELVSGFVSTVYAQSKAKNVEFTQSMEGFEKNSVYIGDSLRLNQILLNLSSNAVKFTPPGGEIHLGVTLAASKSTVDMLRFVISDTGIGMSEDAIERIFKPFEQADASISKHFGGTGLGMSITQNLVRLMSGAIRIESSPGHGTTCIVDLPFQRGTEKPSEPDFSGRGLRALIVDDERRVCEQTALLLEKLKIEAEWRQSGAEALERVKQTHLLGQDFHFCLIDWKMPDMDGLELTRRIRREVDAEVPIVMISANDSSEIEEEARRAGVRDFLPKPLYRSSVYAAIQEALDQGNPSPRPLPGASLLTGRRLLIAEDNAINMEIAVELLKMHGAETVCADDGRQALDAFLASKPGEYDAILMDVQMPVMNGHEAAQRIRASSHPMANVIPIIATTANAFADDISAALASGMNAHVSKPLDIEQLCLILSDCIQKAERA